MDIFGALGLDPWVLIAQIIGLLILFFLFKYFVGDKLQKTVEERRALIAKLDKADETYKQIIADAKKEADTIFAQAEADKVRIVNEGKELGRKKQQELLAEATRESEVLLDNAKTRAEKLSQNLEKDFESSVKHTAKMVVQKLLDNKDTGLQDTYVEQAVKELG